MAPICKKAFSASAKTICIFVLLFTIALIGSAAFIEHVLEIAPCKMCWWQRYGHWGLGALALLGIFSPCLHLRKIMLIIMLPVALISGGIGAYQGLGQLGIVELPASCTGSADGGSNLAPENLLAALEYIELGPDCSDASYTILGITLAGWNFIAMLIFIIILSTWLCKNRRNGAKCTKKHAP